MDTSRNFLRVLAEPKAPHVAEMDIVAVHGLNPFKNTSNAVSTWTSANGKLWLQDEGFLPTQIPNARIMLFGYNSNVAFTSSNAGLVQQAANLLSLLDLRRADCPGRPIVFLCHSLGGILVKRALVHTRLVDSYASLYGATYGIVFFGTPHGGGNNAKVGSLAASIARKLAGRGDNNFMDALKKNSYYGEQNRDDFLHRAKDFSYLTFFEANPTKKFKVFTTQVVDRQNAVLGLDDEREPKFAMDADHSNICKFSDPKGDDYFPVWTNILKMSKLAVEKSKTLNSSILPVRSRGLVPPNADTADKEKSYYILPALSVSCFIKRSALMKQIEVYSVRASNAPCPVIVLLGMGGQGKSQLTMEYCRASRASKQYQAIFWIDVTSDNSLARSFEEITSRICDSAPVFDSLKSRIAFVKDITESWTFPWLLVFDNYDRPDEATRISNCFPQSEFGTVIVTSRHADSARLGNVIKVTGMEEEECLDLLFSRSQLIRTDENISEAKSIIEKLGYLPLAVDQAGSYISAQNLSMSLFVKHYEQRKSHILKYTPSLTEYRKKLNDSDAEIALSVFTTLELSLKALLGDAETRQAIEDFLTLSAFFNRAMIGEDLARIATTEYQTSWTGLFLSEGTWDHYKFQDVMANLNHISLLQSLSPGDVLYFSLHPLVVDWLKLRRNIHYCRSCTILSGSVLCDFFEFKDFENMSLATRQYFLAHIDDCLRNQSSYLESQDFTKDEVLDTLFIFGNFLGRSNRYTEAQEVYHTVVREFESKYGANHDKTLAAVGNFAVLLSTLSKFEEAEEMSLRALRGFETKYGVDHPLTLMLFNSFGVLYREQGKLKEAEEVLQRALCGQEKVLGHDDLSTLDTVNNLGALYKSQGNLREAEEMYQRALRGQEKVLGHDNLSVLGTVNNLGNLYRIQGKLKEAEEMLQRALRGQEKVVGDNNSSTLSTVSNLGLLYYEQDKFKNAEELLQRALIGFKKVYGPNHWETLTVYEGLGLLYAKQGKAEEAEELLHRAIQGFEKLFGPDHPDTIRASENIQWAKNLHSP